MELTACNPMDIRRVLPLKMREEICRAMGQPRGPPCPHGALLGTSGQPGQSSLGPPSEGSPISTHIPDIVSSDLLPSSPSADGETDAPEREVTCSRTPCHLVTAKTLHFISLKTPRETLSRGSSPPPIFGSELRGSFCFRCARCCVVAFPFKGLGFRKTNSTCIIW